MNKSEKFSLEQKQQINEEISKCGCYCHKPGEIVMHVAACCKYSEEKPFKLPNENDAIGENQTKNNYFKILTNKFKKYF